MTLLTYNVREWSRDMNPWSPHFWMKRYAAIRKEIQKSRPDIICFQELSFPANLYVPKDYVRIDKNTSHPVYIDRSVLNKLNGYRCTVTSHYTKVTFYADTIYVLYNVHGTWNKEEQIAMLKDIDDSRMLGLPVIACGDFNMTTTDIQNCGVQWASVREKIGLQQNFTFENYNQYISRAELDHVFMFNFPPELSPFIYMVKSQYWHWQMSDHYPVYVVNKIKQN